MTIRSRACPPRRSVSACFGFSLIELAIGLFVVALILGGILVPLTTQVEQRQISESQKIMDEVNEALVGFAIAKGYLPCPDAMTTAEVTAPSTITPIEVNDGTEDVNTTTGDCKTQSGTVSAGNLPWGTLGVGSRDAWGNRFRYIVVSSFARRSPTFSTVTPNPATPLQVCENLSCSPTSSILSSVPVAIIISHGNNGLGAMNATTNQQNFPMPVGDEFNNTNNTGLNKVYRTKSNLVGSEFDDIVKSISRYTLITRMVAAGKLP